MPIRPIFDTLRHLGGGTVMDDAAEKLADLVKLVDQTGKAGELTIKIGLRKATAGALALSGEVKVKKPAEPKVEALLFATPEGNLLTENPNQGKLDLKEVHRPSAANLVNAS
jgi:hypothetical protein